MSIETWTLIFAALTAIFTFVVAVCSVLVYLAYYRIEWLTGAMESHSDFQRWMKIQEWNAQHPDKSLKAIWWDWSRGEPPFEEGERPVHAAPVARSVIRIGVPIDLRQRRPSAWDRLKFWR